MTTGQHSQCSARELGWKIRSKSQNSRDETLPGHMHPFIEDDRLLKKAASLILGIQVGWKPSATGRAT